MLTRRSTSQSTKRALILLPLNDILLCGINDGLLNLSVQYNDEFILNTTESNGSIIKITLFPSIDVEIPRFRSSCENCAKIEMTLILSTTFCDGMIAEAKLMVDMESIEEFKTKFGDSVALLKFSNMKNGRLSYCMTFVAINDDDVQNATCENGICSSKSGLNMFV